MCPAGEHRTESTAEAGVFTVTGPRDGGTCPPYSHGLFGEIVIDVSVRPTTLVSHV